MKITTALEHSDEVSGTWIMSDGTKCYWTEGRSSGVICILPNKTVLGISVCHMEEAKEDHPEHAELIGLLIKSSEEGPNPDEYRAMTIEEEAEHFAARNC